MANKRHKTEEIVTKLRQVGAVVGQGMARIDGIREVRITKQTFYRCRKQKPWHGDCSVQGTEASSEGKRTAPTRRIGSELG